MTCMPLQVLGLCIAAQPHHHHHQSQLSVPHLALALSSATAGLGLGGGIRLAVRRVMDTKQYWTSASGREFVTCALPGDSSSGSRGACSLIIDPGFKEHFATANMSPRYR